MYETFISQLCMYEKAARILSKVYLFIFLLPPLKLQEILHEVKKAIQTMTTDYDIVIKRLHLYYDMKLVTFGINGDRTLIIQFPVFIQPYMQQPLILYKIETVPALIVDQNKQANSYMHLQINRPYMLSILKLIFWLDSKNSEHTKRWVTNFIVMNSSW